MTREVPARARELAVRLSALFERAVELVKRLNDAQRRLLGANDQLWSGLHPDALGVVYSDTGRVRSGRSATADRMIDAPGAGDGRWEGETAMFWALQRTHWAIRRAFIDYQHASEERRQLAVRRRRALAAAERGAAFLGVGPHPLVDQLVKDRVADKRS